MEQSVILSVSLKDYKKQLDDLRNELTQLDSTSEEYKSTAEKVKQAQEKLNEVMSVGKKDVDAVAGSYNALSQEMSKLKKEWKNMEMGTQAWKDMAVRINEMNDRLKEADASVGVFSRNVGDYANAFSTAFEKSIDGLGKMDGMLGASAKTIKQLIPIIKQANSTAVKGLNGVKAALVSTGIGALIVGVGLLISNWDKLTKIFNKSRKENEKLIESEKTLNEKFEEQNRLLENEITVMTAQGKSTAEINGEKNKLIDTQLEETRATIQETKAKIEEIKAHSWLRRILTGENSDLKGLTETLGELEKIEKNLSNEREKNNASTNAWYESQKQKAKERYEAEEEKVKELLKTIEDANKTEKQKLKEKYDEELALLKKHHKSTKALTQQYNKEIARLDREEATQRAQAIANAMSNLGEYFPRVSIANEFQQATAALNEFNRAADQDFPPQGLVDTILAGKSVGNQFDEAAKKAKELGLIASDSSDEFAAAWIAAYKRVQAAENNLKIYDIQFFKDSERNWEEYLKNLKNVDYIRELASSGLEGAAKAMFNGLDAYTIDLTFKISGSSNTIKAIERQVLDIRDKIQEQFGDDYNLQLPVGIEDLVETLKANDFDKMEGPMKTYYENILMYYKMWIGEEQNLKELQAEQKTRVKELELMYAQVRTNGAEANKTTSPLWNTSKYREVYENRIKEAEAYYEYVKTLQFESGVEAFKAEQEALQAVTDLEREYNEVRLKNHLDFFNQVADIFGSIGSIYDEHINHQKELLKEEGKTDEEANAMLEDKFKAMKAFQIAQATINTISGAITAFMESQKLGQPWGTIIGAAQAAAVTAAGIAQIQKIRNTSIGNTQAPSSIPSTQLPNVADYNPQNVQNVTSASDEQRLQGLLESTNIVVNVSDIDRAQKRVRVRQNEASF